MLVWILFILYVVAQSSYFCKIIKIFSRMEVLLEMQWTAFGWKLFSREIWKITKYIILIYTWSICIVLPNIVKICKTFLMWLWCVMIVTCQVIPCPHIVTKRLWIFFLSKIWNGSKNLVVLRLIALFAPDCHPGVQLERHLSKTSQGAQCRDRILAYSSGWIVSSKTIFSKNN